MGKGETHLERKTKSKRRAGEQWILFLLLEMASPFGIGLSLLDRFLYFSLWTYDNDRNGGMGEAIFANASHADHTHTLP